MMKRFALTVLCLVLFASLSSLFYIKEGSPKATLFPDVLGIYLDSSTTIMSATTSRIFPWANELHLFMTYHPATTTAKSHPKLIVQPTPTPIALAPTPTVVPTPTPTPTPIAPPTPPPSPTFSAPVPPPVFTPPPPPVPISIPTSPPPAPTPVPTSTTSASTPPVLPPPAPAPSPITTPVPLNQQFGFSVGSQFASLSDAQLASSLDDAKSLGITWLRFDISWDFVQHESGSSYDWTATDKLVKAANARGFKLLAIVLNTPPWARIAGCSDGSVCSPSDPKQFAAFAGAAVARYSVQGISHWEVWNEPNLGHEWGSQGNIAGYAQLLTLTSQAIRSKQSNATIVTGGMGPAATDGTDYAPMDFLAGLYKAGVKDSFDAVGMHPYSYPVPATFVANWNAWQQMAQTSTSLRSIMSANGDSAKKVWITEYGAPTGGPQLAATTDNYFIDGGSDHVTEAAQAAIYLSALQAQKTQDWAGPLFFYSYQDLGTDQSDRENFFGVLRFDGSKKPAYATLQQNL